MFADDRRLSAALDAYLTREPVEVEPNYAQFRVEFWTDKIALFNEQIEKLNLDDCEIEYIESEDMPGTWYVEIVSASGHYEEVSDEHDAIMKIITDIGGNVDLNDFEGWYEREEP